MEAHSAWYNRIVKELSPYKDSLDKKDYKKYKLDLLLRLAGRVEDFSSHCSECQTFQGEIARLVQELSLLIQMPNKQSRRGYNKAINGMVKHLQKTHKLVSKGQYMGIGLAIGVGIGTAIGVALDNPGIGPAIGTAIGVAIGSYLDKKAQKEGKVI